MLILVLGLLLTLISVAGSGAFSQLAADRYTEAAASVADSNGIINLTGFNNNYTLTNIFVLTGTIVNNSNKTLQLRLYIDPDITLAQRSTGNIEVEWTLLYRLYISGSTYSSYTFSGKGITNPAGVWTPRYQILPGGTFTVQTNMASSWKKGHSFVADTSFVFDALGTDGISVYIEDTPSSPRTHSYTSSSN